MSKIRRTTKNHVCWWDDSSSRCYGWTSLLLLVLLLSYELDNEKKFVDAFSIRSSSVTTGSRQSQLQQHQSMVSVIPSSSLPLSSSSSSMTKSVMTLRATVDEAVTDDVAQKGKDGIYHIDSEQQHKTFLNDNKDQLVVMKIYAPWCRACKALGPRFQQIVEDKKYKKLPLVFTDLSIQHNKDYVKQLGVLSLPSVQFYLHGQLMETFPCGPSKVGILKKKLANFVNENVDPKTLKVKEPSTLAAAAAAATKQNVTEVETTQQEEEATTATTKPTVTKFQPPTISKKKTTERPLTQRQINQLRALPYFASLTEDDFDTVLQKGRVLSFKEGSIVMREGNPGSTFYFILDGEVEICQQTGFNDPLTTPPSYLGTVVNRLEGGDCFGERALITGEPRAASIRVTQPTRCLVWCDIDLPLSCILNRRGQPSMAQQTAVKTIVDEKYGVTMTGLNDISVDQQIREATKANQIRGSALNPGLIRGVDNDEDIDEVVDLSTTVPSTPQPEPDVEENVMLPQLTIENDTIISLLQRLKLVRYVSKCFDYILTTGAKWGSPAIRRRRNMLLQRLSATQQAEFTDAFRLVDASGDGHISLIELKRVMESIGEEKTDKELKETINKASSRQSSDVAEQSINYADFMGIMAEAEFYYLFRDIFASLDTHDVGFVRAKDLDKVLCGVRDLISDDRKSIIDVEDKDMLIDYEKFTKMLLGTSL